MVVLATENPAADIIAARIFLGIGSRWESRAQAGISHLLASVLTKGTEKLSSLEIAERVESVGAKLGVDASIDYFLMSLKAVSRDFLELLYLAQELLVHPSFPESELELEQKMTIQGIRSQKEQPFSIAFEQLRHAMYQDHPYALSTLGTEETVMQLTRGDLQAHHQTYFRPDNMVISLAGRFDAAAMIAQVAKVFGNWSAPSTPLPTLKLPPLIADPRPTLTLQETQQSVILLGYLTAPVHHRDYMALKLLNTYLGNGLSSRLFVELREKRGLAYDVSALYPTRLDASQFVVYIGTAPENTTTALEGLRTEVERLVAIPLTEEELQAAKNKLLGQYALGKQTNAQIAHIFGWYETLGLGMEFDLTFQHQVNEVTPEMAQMVAHRYFIEPYLSVVGPEAQVSHLCDQDACF